MSRHLRSLVLGVALLAAACGKNNPNSSSSTTSAAASTTSGGSTSAASTSASSSTASGTSGSASSGAGSTASSAGSTGASTGPGSTGSTSAASTGASTSGSTGAASTGASTSGSTGASSTGAASTGSSSAGVGSTGGSSSGGVTGGSVSGSSGGASTGGTVSGSSGGGSTGGGFDGGSSGGFDGGSSGGFDGGGFSYDGGLPVYPNDTCDTATLLTPQHVGDSQVVSGSNLGGSAEGVGSCGGYSSEVYYRLSLAEAARLTATVTGADAGFAYPTLYLAPADCAALADAGPYFGVDLYCRSSFQTTQLDVASLSPGDYLLVVDSNEFGFDFSLSVDLAAPVAPPANDTCASSAGLNPHNPGDTQTVSGTTFGANDDLRGCSAAGADVVYALHLDQAARVQLSVNSPGSSSAQVYLLSSCATTDGGTDSPSCGGTQDLYAVPAGDYLVVVDSNDRAGGPFDLTVTLAAPVYPPVNDQCSGAPVLTAQAPGESDTASGTTFAATQDAYGSCGGYGPDVFYRLHLTQQASLSATVSSADGGFFGSVLYLQPGACPSGVDAGFSNDLVCAANGYPVNIAAASLSPGDYTLVVDSNTQVGDPFALSVSLSAPVPPPANDLCTAAAGLNPHNPGDSQTISGSTFGASDEGQGCNYQGADVYYALHLDQPARVSLVATGPAGQYPPLLGLLDGCGAPDAGSGTGDGGTSVGFACSNVLDQNVVPAGDHLILVEGTRTGSDFTLEVSLSAPVYPPSNDTCAGAVLLSPQIPGESASVTGTVAGANDDVSSCGYFGGDVYYGLHLAQAASIDATLTTGDAGFNYGTVQIMNGGCGGADGGTDGGLPYPSCIHGPTPLTGSVASAPPGDYLIVVDGLQGSSSFSLDVSLGAPH